MNTKTVVSVAIAAGLLVTGAAAQHEEHHQDQATQQPGAATPPQTGNAISGNMMSQMPKMMMGQDETSKLVDQLLKSFEAIETESDPAALKEKLAAHGALLKELQTKSQAQSHMMDMMQHMMGGSMMGTETKR